VHACLKLRIVRARGMQETKRSRIEAPEIAENGQGYLARRRPERFLLMISAAQSPLGALFRPSAGPA
jgi:hypothetical protein